MQLIAPLTGVLVFILLGWLCSSRRRSIRWRTVFSALAIQVLIALFMLKTPIGTKVFSLVNRLFLRLLSYADQGSRFLFGQLVDSREIGATLAFQVLPVIIFVSALMAILVHLGLIQRLVRFFAAVFYRPLRLSGAEAFISTLLIFMGIESITGVKAYIARMTPSRLFTIMTTFMATIAGSVMVAYTSFGAQAGHLLTASLMSAPAAILFAKLMMPDEEEQAADPLARVSLEKSEGNLIAAAASGAGQGLQLVLQIGAVLLAFIGLIHLLTDLLAWTGHEPQKLLGMVMAPVAWLLGVPWSEALQVGEMLAVKTIFSEFLAYLQLQDHIAAGSLSPRTIVISTYALCGFTHFGSIAILIGGIGTLVPQHKQVLASLSLKALLAAFLATSMTACLAGLLA